MTEMKYLRIFENALRRLGLSKKDVKDWKPAGDTYVPEIGEIKGAIVIWTYDGREILFREKCDKRYIEVYRNETIGSLIRRLVQKEESSLAIKDRDPLSYRISDETWRSRIPEAVLLPEEVISDDQP
jgi:hypothetical protein